MVSVEDRLAIHELLALHGHLMDEGSFDRLDELFSDDFIYDLTALGHGQLKGREELVRSALDLGAGNPLGHHVTNVVIVEANGDEATVRSKGLAIRKDGSTGTVVYEDRVTRTTAGWRIRLRTVIPRIRPLESAPARPQ
jgi:3-phenylpropionate/cinnamic acid dioxygenase small subunit